MALEIKVTCDCGQRYKFDVAPVNGLMPFPVNCPVCGAEGTTKANALIQQALASPPPQPVPTCPIAPAAAPRIRINTPAAPAPVAVAASAIAPPVPAAPPIGRPAFTPGRTPAPAQAKAATPCNFPLGALGAVLGGALAMLAWFFLIKLTDREIGIAAWGVGVITGLGARLLSRGGTPVLGITAASCAFVAIIGGQFLYVKTAVDKVFDGLETTMTQAYNSRMAFARDAVKAQTDDEIKALLIKHQESEQPTPEEIKEFREKELPKLKAFANGKPSKAEFEKKFTDVKSAIASPYALFKESIGLFTILWVVLGMSSAYKIGEG